MNPIRVVAAVFWRLQQGQIEVLLFQRLSSDLGGGHWEFPGGKIDQGETPEQALAREIQEELSIEISIQESLGRNLHQYPQALIDLQIYRCEPKDADFENQIRLVDHHAFAWFIAKDLIIQTGAEPQQVELSAADRPLLLSVLKAAKIYFQQA